MDQFLDEGCWLQQTSDKSNLLQSSLGLGPGQIQGQGQDQGSEPSTSHSLNLSYPPYPLFPSCSIKDRLVKAIYNLKDMNGDRDVLIQLWVPIKKGLHIYLTTFEQPYFYQDSSKRLHNYRGVSEKYEFLVDEDTKQALGSFPGRVFLGKAPEWTPDVRLFREEEYPRSVYAFKYDVRGSIALPIFEKDNDHSLGVVEIIMTTDKFDYRPQVECVCKALETVHLRSSEIFNIPQQVEKVCYEAVQFEILNVVRTVCDTFDLPLAQTWAPCSQQRKEGYWHSDNNATCVSIIESACYVHDQRVQEFHKACTDHHLLKRRGGIVRKAFETNQPCYATDVTEFSKVEYTLSHYAKMCGLYGAVAVKVHSIYHEVNDYVLEFYLPSNIKEKGLAFHARIWQTVATVIQQNCRFLQSVTGQDIGEQAKETSWVSQMIHPKRKGKEVVVSLEFRKDEPSKGFEVMNWSENEPSLQLGQALSDEDLYQDNSESKGVSGSCLSSVSRFPLGGRKSGEKRRTKTQKTISLDVLRQYFSGSLKDAAKSIGVCPTTLKRICRQHGIARWPSRKIKKVDHSLRKLQLVIDSVEGTEGAIRLSSFYTNFPDLNSPNTQPKSNQVSSINLNNQPKQQLTTEPEGSLFPSGGATASNSSSSTSSSQTSSSSYCFSSGEKLTSSPVTAIASESKEASFIEIPGRSLKRARSEAELQVLSKKRAKQILERSRRNKTLAEHPLFETLPPLLVTKSLHSRKAGHFKAKVTFGEEKVRFSILPNMGFQDLQKEIAKRFSLEDLSKICIKYLDDDKEWILLTCNADLEECIDIHKSSRSHTIKLTVSPLSGLAGSFGSCGLS
ncbi:protein NLP2-like isoform X1 [Amaranthus tricolor]|uniref:protein NLP2-like isoform X1 n=1 Tax=Amaranthus tricolor TaxID=29722 RepID=UPI002588DB0F|nr:protein NLP2-like isoform X1 [Amaranthus tricolor]